MGTGSSVNVSSQQVVDWMKQQSDATKSMAEENFRSTHDALIANRLMIAESVFSHIAHDDDYSATANVTNQIAMIENALFDGGQHPAVKCDTPPNIPPSGAVRVVGEALTLFGQLHTKWATDVQNWFTVRSGDNYNYNDNYVLVNTVGAGLTLGAIQYSDLTPGPDTIVTHKGYICTSFKFTLVYSHEDFLKYEQSEDDKLIKKIKDEMKKKMEAAAAKAASQPVNRTGVATNIDSGAAIACINQSNANFWSSALAVIEDAEKRANTASG